MFRQTVKSLLDRKARLVMTVLAIMLGVAVATGVLVAATSLGRAIDELFAGGTTGADLVLRGSDDEPMAALVVDDVAAVPGVEEATGSVSGRAQLIGVDGDPVGGGSLTEPSEGTTADWAFAGALVAGALPQGAGQAVIDQASARQEGFGVGDTVEVVAASGVPVPFEVVGVVDLPARRGAPLVGFDLETARDVLGRASDEVDAINVRAEPGTDVEELGERVSAALGADYSVLPAADLAAEAASGPRGELATFTALLLVVSAFALLIGGLIIHNTFSIVVAQRIRELGLLRCIGASRAQLRRSVLVEALIVGIAGSVLGVAVGIWLARLMRRVLESFDAFEGLPATTMEVAPWIVIVSVSVGLVVTLTAALAPARRATRVPPMAALRDDVEAPQSRLTRRRRWVGWSLTAVAVTLIAAAAGGAGGGAVAIGGLLLLVGMEVLGPAVVGPAARVLGAPVAFLLGMPGRLARNNTARAPGRTAATAMALLIGVALTTFMGVWAHSQKETRHQQFDEGFTADYRVDVPGTDFSGPIDPAALTALEAVPAVDTTTPFSAPDDRSTTAAPPAAVAQLLAGDVVAGDLDDLVPGTVAVSRDHAESSGWSVGEDVPVTVAGTTERFALVAIYDSYMLDARGLIEYEGGASRGMNITTVMTPDDFVRLGGSSDIGWIYVDTSPGSSTGEIDQALRPFPTVQVHDREALRTQGDAAVDVGIRIFYGFLGLLIVISLFGIINTLALSIHERIRELGLLRAVGLGRRQAVVMVSAEAVVIGLIGAVTGMALGTVLFWAMTASAAEGSDLDLVLSLPLAQLALIAGFAIVTAAIAAIPPSIQASRIDILRAVTTE